MIGGTDPLIVIYYTTKTYGVEIPTLPISIYLSENTSGFVVKGCSSSLNIQSESVAGSIFQRGVSSSTTLTIQCNSANQTANTFLPLLKTIFSLINSADGTLNNTSSVKGHQVSLFNGNHIVLFGKISAMTWDDSDDNDLINITLTIDEGKDTSAAVSTQSLSRTTGSALVRGLS